MWEHTAEEMELDGTFERQMFGKEIRDMTFSDFSVIHGALLKDRNRRKTQSKDTNISSVNAYRLINVPVVFHILINQDNRGDGSPSMTDAQRDYMINRTNELFQIYNRQSKTTATFMTVVANDTIVHDGFERNFDCRFLRKNAFEEIVTKAVEWEFKFHALVCESALISGFATGFARRYEPTDVRHNLLAMDYRALACYNYETGEYLCDNFDSNNNPISHTRWWRTRSTVLAHEIGHLMSLAHTFTGGCSVGDGIPDTPFESSNDAERCPGLLPYDKDRDLFDTSQAQVINAGANDTVCGAKGKVCDGDCAACCKSNRRFPFFFDDEQCDKSVPRTFQRETVTEDEVDFPVCCRRRQDRFPSDTCPFRPGVDPKNNVMSYSPDWCIFEFTPGQMTKMMAATREHKTYLYCNYADVQDEEICSEIPCSSIATSPNCGS